MYNTQPLIASLRYRKILSSHEQLVEFLWKSHWYKLNLYRLRRDHYDAIAWFFYTKCTFIDDGRFANGQSITIASNWYAVQRWIAKVHNEDFWLDGKNTHLFPSGRPVCNIAFIFKPKCVVFELFLHFAISPTISVGNLMIRAPAGIIFTVHVVTRDFFKYTITLFICLQLALFQSRHGPW